MARGTGTSRGEPVCSNEKTVAGNERVLAGPAVGVFLLADPTRDVSSVDVAETGRLADLCGTNCSLTPFFTLYSASAPNHTVWLKICTKTPPRNPPSTTKMIFTAKL